MRIIKLLSCVLPLVFILSGCGATRTSHFNILQSFKPGSGLVQINVQDTEGYNFGSYLVKIQQIKADGTDGATTTLSSTAFGTTSTFQFLGPVKPGKYKLVSIYYYNGGYRHTLDTGELAPFNVEQGQLTHLGSIVKNDLTKGNANIGLGGYYVISHVPCSADVVCDTQAKSKEVLKHHFPKLTQLLTNSNEYIDWNPEGSKKTGRA